MSDPDRNRAPGTIRSLLHSRARSATAASFLAEPGGTPRDNSSGSVAVNRARGEPYSAATRSATESGMRTESCSRRFDMESPPSGRLGSARGAPRPEPPWARQREGFAPPGPGSSPGFASYRVALWRAGTECYRAQGGGKRVLHEKRHVVRHGVSVGPARRVV